MPASSVVAIGILGGASVILDGNLRNIHVEWTLGKIDISTSPVASTLGLWVSCGGSINTSNPATHLYAHGSLGEVLSIKGKSISIVESSDQVGTNVPLNVIGRPVDCVGDGCADRVGNIVVDGSVIGGGVSLSEEVTLDGGIGGSQPFPINFIEIVGLENETADSSSSGAGLHGDRDLSEHDVLLTAHCWRVGLDSNLEDGSVGVVAHGCAISQSPVRALSLGEIGDKSCSQRRVGRTCCRLLVLFGTTVWGGEHTL